MAYLLDSVIIIDHLNGVSEATQLLAREPRSLFVSVITRAEVLTGYAAHDIGLIKQFLDSFQTISMGKEDADLAALLRRREKWKLPDAFQAALAQNHQLTLLTRNTKDFTPERHSFVQIPYSL